MARARGSWFLPVLGLCALSVLTQRLVFVPTSSTSSTSSTRSSTRSSPAPSLERRMLFGALFTVSQSADAAAPKTVLVAGATGQTGRRIVERLAKDAGTSVIGGVRDVSKAKSDLVSSFE